MVSPPHPPLPILSSPANPPDSDPTQYTILLLRIAPPLLNPISTPPTSRSAAIGLILQHGHVDNKDLSHSFKLNKNPARGANESRPPQSHGAGAGSGHGR